MNRNDFVWVLECCLLSLDGVSKKKLIEFGASNELAEAGIKLCEYLLHKEINVYNVNNV